MLQAYFQKTSRPRCGLFGRALFRVIDRVTFCLFCPAAAAMKSFSSDTTSADNFASLINDVEDRLFAVLPDDTWFYPGHGDDSTLGKERPSLAEWRARGW